MRWAFVLLLGIAACRSAPVGPYTPPGETARDTIAAEKLNREAADLIATDLVKAEGLLREALTKDLFYGPAHNNLGVVFLKQDKLYEASNEFEWARKLLPDSPDPRVNLALVLERAGRTDEAFRAYEAALEVAPDSVAAMQGAASCGLSHGREDSRIEGWLGTITMRGENLAWRDWATRQQFRN